MDWDDAYDNFGHIEGAEGFPPLWAAEAEAFRTRMGTRAETGIAYGRHVRHRLDLFRPEGPSRGLAVFLHGGYWKAFSASDWSHLAAGAVERGWTVCIPSYRLAPEVHVADITRDAAAAIEFAPGLVPGPIRLAGHSAGGHLVCRMVCATTPLGEAVAGRIGHVLSISGLHDLRPLKRTKMNEVLRLSPPEAHRESPALNEPRAGSRVTAWVGGAERPEFIRQAMLIANAWSGLGAETQTLQSAGRHHFDVIAELADADSAMTAHWLAE